jgi:hypothetical protein
MIYPKFIGTPTSHGHVQFPIWKFSNLFLVLPPTTSITPPTYSSIYLTGLDDLVDAAPHPPPLSSITADPVTDNEFYVPFLQPHRFLHLCRCGSQPTRGTVTQCPFWYEPPTFPSLLTTNCPDSPHTSTNAGLNAGILKFQLIYPQFPVFPPPLFSCSSAVVIVELQRKVS